MHADHAFADRFENLVTLHIQALVDYFEKVMPTLESPRAVLRWRPERVFYRSLCLRNWGACPPSCYCSSKSRGGGISNDYPQRHHLSGQSAFGVLLPLYDGHTIDLTLLFCALMGESGLGQYADDCRRVVARLHHALRTDCYLPVDTDSQEDAIALDRNKAESRDFFQTSTLVPALATVTSLLGDEAFQSLRDKVLPLMKRVTLERWFPTALLENFSGSTLGIHSVGISRHCHGLRPSVKEEAEASINSFDDAAAPSDFRWYCNWQIHRLRCRHACTDTHYLRGLLVNTA